MSTSSRERGVEAALATYGCTKLSGVMDYVRAVSGVMFGDPGKYFQELRHGKFFSPGSLFRASLDPRINHFSPTTNKILTGLNAAAMYGIPAYQVYQASKLPESDRGTAIGSSLGAALGSTLAAPLGVVGNIAGTTLGSALGSNVGHAFDSPRTADPAAYEYR